MIYCFDCIILLCFGFIWFYGFQPVFIVYTEVVGLIVTKTNLVLFLDHAHQENHNGPRANVCFNKITRYEQFLKLTGKFHRIAA